MQYFETTFRLFLIVSINFSCMVFVIWKTIECIQTYADVPIGTKLGMKKSADLPFPDITVCGNYETEEKKFIGAVTQFFNNTYLREICEMTISNYRGGEWRNNNTDCTEAKKLFEAIVFKPEDIIKKVDIGFWSTTERQSYNYLQSKNQWHHIDSSYCGRCFTFKPSPEQIKKEINGITLTLGVDSDVFTHTPGMILTQPENKMTFNGGEVSENQKAEVNKMHWWGLNHEHHELLVDYRGGNCNDERQYMKDFCVDKAIEKESIDKVGCTTPYGPDKSQICNIKSDALVAHGIYHYKGAHNWDDNNSTIECLNPCSIFTFTTKKFNIISLPSAGSAVIHISFERFIKSTTEYYIYTEINLIGEVGGYVGLFLGISVNQVIYLMDFTASKIKQLHKIF